MYVRYILPKLLQTLHLYNTYIQACFNTSIQTALLFLSVSISENILKVFGHQKRGNKLVVFISMYIYHVYNTATDIFSWMVAV